MPVSAAAVSGARPIRAPRPERGLRVIHVGVLGLGNVGQAVVRAAAASAATLRERGMAVSIDAALVRDVARPRRCPKVARLTNNVEAFMRGRYDVVIDALAGCTPAGAIAGRLLGKGIPVVSANKVLIAAEGPRLRRIAARAGSTLRVEASVMAGVPFLGAFERRPLVADVTRFAGIVNGTSHFILSKIAAGALFQAALAEAQTLGYAEPNPDADISGRDALEKLIVLAEVLLERRLLPTSIVPAGITGITPAVLDAAAGIGGAIKPVVFGARESSGSADLSAFVGPAWVPSSHPLASVSGRDNAIVIDSRFSGRLVFAGPGAGPDVTAATLLDDAIEAATETRPPAAAVLTNIRPHQAWRRPVLAAARVTAPETAWFVRVSGSDPIIHDSAARTLADAGLCVQREQAEPRAIAWLIARAAAERIAAAAAAFGARGLSTQAWRALDV